MKLRLLLGLCLSVVAVGLVGCGSGEAADSTNPAENPATSTQTLEESAGK